MPHILFQPRSTFVQLILGTRDHLYPVIAIQTHLDQFLGPLRSKFRYLWIAKEVRVVSPYIPYPVLTAFNLVQTILHRLDCMASNMYYIFLHYILFTTKLDSVQTKQPVRCFKRLHIPVSSGNTEKCTLRHFEYLSVSLSPPVCPTVHTVVLAYNFLTFACVASHFV